ncbi:MAG: MG2 domain-containing protein [candidate division WOR-3 bacterium]|nr:MG2 domain-containing protein [candidate division WOR-3 bacterium]
MKIFLPLGLGIVVLGLVTRFNSEENNNELNLSIPLVGLKGELGKCEIKVLDPEDNVVGTFVNTIYINKDYYSFPAKIKLKKEIYDPDLLRIKVKFKKYEKIYSLFQLQDRMTVKILGQDQFIYGTPIKYRIIVKNQKSDEPIPGANVKVILIVGDKEKKVYEGMTDNSGTCETNFTLGGEIKNARLKFIVTSELGKDEYEASIKLTSGNITYLVTDKPIYQPGQTIHIRTLSLQKPGLNAVKDKEIVFEVEDAKGNKVFKKSVKTDKFGTAYTPFILADEVNFGNWVIRALLDNEKTEKTVKVEKYVLPKFKITFKSDKEFYLPGEKLEGNIDVQYFFGKPVVDGKVKITVYKFDVGFNEEAVIEGKTDKDGSYHFSYKLPDYFVGEPLEKGDAFVRLDIEVIDKANHSEKITVTKKIVQNSISIAIVPEGGLLKPNLENRIYIVANYPDGSPCLARIEMDIDGKRQINKTDDYGVAEFVYRPQQERVKIRVKATDNRGESAEIEKEFTLDTGHDQIIMRMKRGIYKVGDKISLEFLTTKKTGRVYLDIIKDNQTVLTKSIEIEDGKGNYQITLTPELSGSIWLHAYIVTSGSDIIRDTRFCYVHGANDLMIKVEPDKKEYLPGDDGEILFTITDKNGKPKIAALCLAIVDEAVFAVSELQPGLEKVYFTLEKEIMTPRYEIHGFEPANIVRQPAIDERAEIVMFSTLTPKEPFPVNYTTPVEVNEKIAQAFYKKLFELREKLQKALNKYYDRYQNYPRTENALKEFIKEGFLKEEDLLDPWNRRYRITCGDEYFTYFTIASAGPDGVFDNDDDVTEWDRRRWRRFEGLAEEGVFAMPVPSVQKSATMDKVFKEKKGPEEPRVREYFPETFIFEPAIITDARGKAKISVTMPDAITTWRMTMFASTQKGELGSNLAQIKVFQDFFVDIDLPVALTQGDEISIPVAIYNYLPKQQKIRLVLENEGWFDILGEREITKTLSKDEVSVVYFPIWVKELGYHSITVKAFGEVKSDAIKRQISVLPDGKRFESIISDRLEGNVIKKIGFPANAIPGANSLVLKLYPGIYSQVVEGLDKMLGMPYGCFEQTSSVTYPNILILNYLRQTQQIKPETEMKAEGYISIGYQRLLSFEVKNGGFSWFGDEPANKILTAYGLMEFNDMSKVYDIDERVIERTAQWLKEQQNKDGSWSPDKQYLHAEAWGRIQNNEILPTAYIVWALAEAGQKDGSAQKGLDYLKDKWEKVNDAYILALIANAFVAMEPKTETTIKILRKLIDMAKEENGALYWESNLPSITFTEGKGADIEASGLATYALVKSGKFADATTKALTYLIRSKDPSGTWYTTQGTIIALRALVAALGGVSEDVDATVIVFHNGKKVSEIKVDRHNADVMQQVDLNENLKNENTVEIQLKGEGSFLYEITSSYYIPWKDLPKPPMPIFAIDVNYDRKQLAINDLVNVDVTIKLLKNGTAQMVMIDLGIPPGFEVQTPTLDEYVNKKVIQKYNLTPRQIIIYIESISSGKPIKLTYSLKAKYPVRAKVQSSRVYEYYNSDKEVIAEPFEIRVAKN